MNPRTLTVSRGGKDLDRRRYLFRVEAASDMDDATAGLTLACKGKHSSRQRLQKGEWVLLDDMADTQPSLPGHDSCTLTLTISAHNGAVRFRRPRLYHVPAYGIRLRFTVLDPSAGRYNGRLRIIRRHRDTGHRDRIRHYFYSTTPDITGDKGVMAGDASPWFDLRPYLFGRSRATVSLMLNGNARPAPGRKTRARLELAFCMDQELGAAALAVSPCDDVQAFLSRDRDGFDPDLDMDDDRNRKPEALVFWQRELDSKNGIFSFLMPESDMGPSAFFEGVLSLDGDVVDRLKRVRDELGPMPLNEGRILLGANVSALAGLIDEASIEKEMELLAALGLNTICGGEVCKRAFCDARHDRHGQTRFRNREYWARIKSGHSPCDGDKLRMAMDEYYGTLALQHPVFGNPTDPRNVYLFDIMDEPGDRAVRGVEQSAFAAFLKGQGMTPQQVGFETWDAVRSYGYGKEDKKAFVPPELSKGLLTVPQTNDLTALLLDEPVEVELDEEPLNGDALPQDIKQKRRYYYTRSFSARTTSDFFKTATDAIGKHFPGVLTCVNFRAGFRRVLTPETADWFLMGREKAVTMMWNEDWLNTYGWRRNGIQLVSYYVELMRTAARKHDLPVGGFLMCYWGQAELKSYSALAHGSRYLNYWRYGPGYANYLPYSWSHSDKTVKQIGTICRDVARLDATLPDAVRAPAPVALLYAKTDPIWRRGQKENRLVFMALLHDQVPVDIITEAQIEEDGALDGSGEESPLGFRVSGFRFQARRIQGR